MLSCRHPQRPFLFFSILGGLPQRATALPLRATSVIDQKSILRARYNTKAVVVRDSGLFQQSAYPAITLGSASTARLG
jgi:hypothetical protein